MGEGRGKGRKVKRTASFQKQAEQVRNSKRREHAADDAALLEIMARSGNAFVQMLSEAERESLMSGRGPDGTANCRYHTFEEGETVVQQGEEGHSMFIVMHGELRVMVTFTSGNVRQCKEVAVSSCVMLRV